jgi:hypothetical protein
VIGPAGELAGPFFGGVHRQVFWLDAQPDFWLRRNFVFKE